MDVHRWERGRLGAAEECLILESHDTPWSHVTCIKPSRTVRKGDHRNLNLSHGFFQCFIITRSTHQHRKQRLLRCWSICSKPLQPDNSPKHPPIFISRPRDNAPQCYSIGVGRKDKQPICILLSNAKHHSERLWTEGEATRFRVRHERMLIKRAPDWFSLAWIFW